MVNIKSIITIETVINSFLFPCKFTAISFCIPLEWVFYSIQIMCLDRQHKSCISAFTRCTAMFNLLAISICLNFDCIYISRNATYRSITSTPLSKNKSKLKLHCKSRINCKIKWKTFYLSKSYESVLGPTLVVL